jgi:hypothetical protein
VTPPKVMKWGIGCIVPGLGDSLRIALEDRERITTNLSDLHRSYLIGPSNQF